MKTSFLLALLALIALALANSPEQASQVDSQEPIHSRQKRLLVVFKKRSADIEAELRSLQQRIAEHESENASNRHKRLAGLIVLKKRETELQEELAKVKRSIIVFKREADDNAEERQKRSIIVFKKREAEANLIRAKRRKLIIAFKRDAEAKSKRSADVNVFHVNNKGKKTPLKPSDIKNIPGVIDLRQFASSSNDNKNVVIIGNQNDAAKSQKDQSVIVLDKKNGSGKESEPQFYDLSSKKNGHFQIEVDPKKSG